jgi:cell division protease FtsH
VQAGGMIGADTLMQAAERVMVGNVNANTTKERERDRRIIAIHEWGHFLVTSSWSASRPAAIGSESNPR